MDLASPIWPIERRIARCLEIIIEFLRRLGNDLAGLELVRGRDRNRRRVGLQSAPPMIRSSRKTRPPADVGGASDAKGPVEDVHGDHRGFCALINQPPAAFGNLFASHCSTSSGWYPNGPGFPLNTIVPVSSTM